LTYKLGCAGTVANLKLDSSNTQKFTHCTIILQRKKKQKEGTNYNNINKNIVTKLKQKSKKTINDQTTG